jgi:hypothetical protein
MMNMDLIEEIRQKLQDAEARKKLTATFHALILAHANELEQIDPKIFCEKVGVGDVWKVEFKKMIAAAKMLREHGFDIMSR